MAQNWHKNFALNIMADRHLYGHLIIAIRWSH